MPSHAVIWSPWAMRFLCSGRADRNAFTVKQKAAQAKKVMQKKTATARQAVTNALRKTTTKGKKRGRQSRSSSNRPDIGVRDHLLNCYPLEIKCSVRRNHQGKPAHHRAGEYIPLAPLTVRLLRASLLRRRVMQPLGRSCRRG